MNCCCADCAHVQTVQDMCNLLCTNLQGLYRFLGLLLMPLPDLMFVQSGRLQFAHSGDKFCHNVV